MTRVLALVATLPARRASCERLLQELARQSRVPDGVILFLDGYGDAPAPACPLVPLLCIYRTSAPSGPGQRWQVACDFAPDDLLVCIDDDAVLTESPHFIRALAETAERGGGAAAAMGYTPQGHRRGPAHFAGDRTDWVLHVLSTGRLILGCGCGLAVRAGHLEGLQALAAEVLAAGGPDALGPCGDDQALVSAHLWRQGVPLLHAAVGALSFAPGTAATSQTRARQGRGETTLHEQARAIAQITGWPFPEPVVELERVRPLTWEEELSAVPEGAVRVQVLEAPPPAGRRRVLVVDQQEPERSGVYDVPG